eukprot:CAMPEP_0197444968 /NCGR_PEP_ID=MMETSP1175-20131217/10299_1 /TAXON_ID=1003142 /ORGANISM="Triceratium dubium, Strain CCMP147" /LENGTH=197 /DNA_ID=CAMNT_0042975847 /DNA_START=36 /DNA_END=629 /DNA_ORIENTATION=+
MQQTMMAPALPRLTIHLRQRRFLSGFETIVENQINAWQRKGGEDDLQNKGKKLEGGDRHRHVANSLGVGADYVHSKILADNNIKPESVQRRLDLERAWDGLKAEIRTSYREAVAAAGRGGGSTTNATVSIDEFARSGPARERFEAPMRDLDGQAKRVNDAIIGDSLLFNGRSPVRHARRFDLEERIMEALREDEESV